MKGKMASNRMFNKLVVMNDKFLDMPISTRCLYFTLGMLADDDGFLDNAKSIARQISAQPEDDVENLINQEYLIRFDSGVVVIKHWHVHNNIRKDRYNETKYKLEKSRLMIEDDIYILRPNDNQVTTNGIPNDNQVTTNGIPNDNQVHTPGIGIGIGTGKIYPKKNIKKEKASPKAPLHAHGEFNNVMLTDFEEFWKEYPRKVGKQAAKKAYLKLKPTRALSSQILEAVKTQKNSRAWLKDNGQYIPNPTTWLNQGRWEDEITETGSETWDSLDELFSSQGLY